MAGHKVQHVVLSLMHLIHYANQWEHFQKHAVTGNTTQIVWDPIHPPSPPSNHDMETPTSSPSKGLQSHAIGKETYGNFFLRTCRCAWAHTTNQTCDSLCCYGWKVTHHPLILQPVFSISLDPLKRPGWLASDLQQTPILSKLSPPGNMLYTSVFYARTQALVSWWNKYLNVHGQQIVQPNLHIVTAAI